MKVYQELEQLPAFHKAVITIGSFDGVHLGHRQILAQVKEEAKKVGGETVIISFHPHPRQVISGRTGGLRLLTSLEERIKLLESLGIDHFVVIPFTDAFAQMEAADFVRDFLVSHFHPHTIITGYDHRFGRNRLGDYRLLEQMSAELGFRVKEIDARLIDRISISSTRIRNALQMARAEEAKALLGYAYFFEGTVVEGDQRGRSIGFPTANVQLSSDEKLLPGAGVYAVRVAILSGSYSGQQYLGMMNIGYRPTLNGKDLRTEVNLFDFTGDLYHCVIRVQVEAFIRGEQKFEGLEALKMQLAVDQSTAAQLLSGSKSDLI